MDFADFFGVDGQPVTEQEGGYDAGIKNSNVQRGKVEAQDSGIGIKKDGDKERARKQGGGIAAEPGSVGIPLYEPLKKKVEKHGEKK